MRRWVIHIEMEIHTSKETSVTTEQETRQRFPGEERIKESIQSIKEPLKGLGEPLKGLKEPIQSLKDPIMTATTTATGLGRNYVLPVAPWAAVVSAILSVTAVAAAILGVLTAIGGVVAAIGGLLAVHVGRHWKD